MMENAMITMKNINKGYMLGEERLPILKDINEYKSFTIYFMIVKSPKNCE